MSYYNNKNIAFKIFPYTYKRETAFIHSKLTNKPNHMAERYLRCHNAQHVMFLADKFNIERDKLNMYYSLAKYNNGIPHRTFKDDSTTIDEWKENHHKHMESFDFLIDIDGKNKDFDFAIVSAQLLFNRLKKEKKKFDLRFSGRGFHFIIEDKKKLSFDPTHPNNIYAYQYGQANKYRSEISEMIDTRIYESRRVVKVPYSLAYYDDGVFMCSPITSLKGFTREHYRLNIVELQNG